MVKHVQIKGIPPRIRYVANGTQTEFEFPFAIFKASQLTVYLGDELQNVSTYTVTGVNETNGGKVTFGTAPASNTIVTLLRDLDIERTSDFQEGSTLRADTLNYELDYQIACQQQIADNLNRSMVLPPYAVGTDISLQLPSPEAGKSIVWNSSGDGLENSNVEVNVLEATLNGYKNTAATASATATAQAQIATTQASSATTSATSAAASAATASAAANGKANADMDNLTTTGKVQVAHLAMPSAQYVDYPLTTMTSTQVAAPADGYFSLSFISASAYRYIRLKNVTTGMKIERIIDVSEDTGGFLPVRKDDVVEVYAGYATLTHCRFYKAEGAIS